MLPRFSLLRITGDGDSFVACVDDSLRIYDATTFTERASTETQLGMIFVETSPDGEWIATGTWHHKGVKVWNARTGGLERDLPSDGIAMVNFSPDGRWLAVRDSQCCRLWNVGDWTPSFQIDNIPGDKVGCLVAFTHDARIAALRRARSSVLLVDTIRGNELALLESPDALDISFLCFVANDTRLVAARGKNPLCVWELRPIRERLVKMELDWDAPPLFSTPSKPAITAVKVIADEAAKLPTRQ
jgi:WD40 repeat protein